MPIKETRVRVTLQENPNLKVTAKTREHLGIAEVGAEDEVQARLLGIPGPQGEQGDPGPPGPEGSTGPIGVVWLGEYNPSLTYSKGNAVSYFGSSYIYTNDVPASGIQPDTNPLHWGILAEKGDDGAPGQSNADYAAVEEEPTGFPNLSDSIIQYNNTTRYFTIQPSVGGGTFDYYVNGTKRTVSAPESQIWPNISTTFFFYYDTDHVLKISTSFPIPLNGKATVAMLNWDADTQQVVFFGEERHGLVMDWATHAYLHETQGCQYANGLDLYWDNAGDGSTEDEIKIGISDGVVYDEDLRHRIRHATSPVNFFEQVLYPVAKVPVWYRINTDGDWKSFTANNYPIRFGTNFPQYNEYTGSTWQLSDADNNDYYVMWLFATNNVHSPIVAVMGQHVHNNLETSLSLNSLSTLELGVLPSPEFKLLYRLVYQTKNQYTNTFKTIMVQVDDYRAVNDKYGVGNPLYNEPGSVSGDKHYPFEQTTPNTEWLIVHGLNKYPAIEVIDDTGNWVEGDVEYLDINTIKLTFSQPIIGKAYFN